jgi:hypothetical protein
MLFLKMLLFHGPNLSSFLSLARIIDDASLSFSPIYGLYPPPRDIIQPTPLKTMIYGFPTYNDGIYFILLFYFLGVNEVLHE